jgi:hypothetical protein
MSVNINRLWIRIVDNLIPPIRVDFAAMSTDVENIMWKKRMEFQVYFVIRRIFHIRKFLGIKKLFY